MAEPYYQDKWVTIYHGDCREILPQLDVKVDLVLTDPPYGVGKAEWDDNSEWLLLMDYLGEYLSNKELAIIFCATRYIGKTITRIKLPYHWQFIAYSPNNMIPADIGFAKYTSALIFSNRKSIHNNTQDLREYMAGTNEFNGNNHPTPKPIACLKYLIKQFSKPEELVLDPFLGSGTTCFASKVLNRYSIGIEIEEKYCEIAAKRCSQEVMELGI